MKKKILILLVVMLLTGCKVQYNLVVNKDLSIKEEVNMTGTNSWFESFPMTSKITVLTDLLESGNRKQTLLDNGYTCKIVNEDLPYIQSVKNYTNFNEYINNTIFIEQYFNKLNYQNDNGIITIASEGFKPVEEDDNERYYISDFTLKITVPYNVKDNNADQVDEKTNSYYWNISSKTKDMQIKLVFDSNSNYNPYTKLIIYSCLGIALVIGFWIYAAKSKKKMI